MTRGPIISSSVDLTTPDNIVQARHELHQAIDFGGEAECAAWCRKWGEAALAAGEVAARESMDWDGFSTPGAIDKAIELHNELLAAINKETPDIADCRRLAGRANSKLADIAEAFEE